MGGNAGAITSLALLGPLALPFALPQLTGANKAPKVNVPKNNTLGETNTELKPGEKANLVNTTPQGVLDPDTSRRATLLGN